MLAGYLVLMMALLVLPTDAGAAGAFADSFRQWCFKYDAATGGLEWGYVWMYLARPVVVAGVVVAVWRPELRVASAMGWRRIARCAVLSNAAIAILALGLFSIWGWDARVADERAFPGERIRTSLTPPGFELVNQDGALVSPDAMEGRVVVVTAVYATCPTTCPMIIGQAKSAIGELDPAHQDDVAVLALTLDPATDTPVVLRALAAAHGVEAPQFQFLTGSEFQVQRALEGFQIPYRRSPDGAQIDHANLFILIDRGGRIAYRLSLGETQAEWLNEALRQLVDEEAPRS